MIQKLRIFFFEIDAITSKKKIKYSNNCFVFNKILFKIIILHNVIFEIDLIQGQNNDVKVEGQMLVWIYLKWSNIQRTGIYFVIYGDKFYLGLPTYGLMTESFYFWLFISENFTNGMETMWVKQTVLIIYVRKNRINWMHNLI